MARDDDAGHRREDFSVPLASRFARQGGDLRLGQAKAFQAQRGGLDRSSMLFARHGWIGRLGGKQDVFTLGIEQRRAVDRGDKLPLDHVGAGVIHEQFVDAAFHISREKSVAGVVVLDRPRGPQGVAQRLAADLDGLNVEHRDGVRAERDEPSANINSFVAFIHRHEVHAADGAFAGLVGFDPRVHGALVEADLAFARRWPDRSCRPVFGGEPAGAAGECGDKQNQDN